MAFPSSWGYRRMKVALLVALMEFFSLWITPPVLAENGTERSVDKLHERMRDSSRSA